MVQCSCHIVSRGSSSATGSDIHMKTAENLHNIQMIHNTASTELLGGILLVEHIDSVGQKLECHLVLLVVLVASQKYTPYCQSFSMCVTLLPKLLKIV